MSIIASFIVFLLVLGGAYIFFISIKLIGILPKKGSKLVIFDFDGTICDSYDVVIKIFNSIANDYGVKQIDLLKKQELKSQSIKDVMNDHGVTLSRLPLLTRRVRKELSSCIHELKPFEGIRKIIQDLKNSGNNIGILTTNSGSNVKAFLKANGMDELFQFIVHGSSVYGKSNILQYIMKKTNLTEYYYIGDEVRDIEAVLNKDNLYSVAVTWGYNNKLVLQSYNPDFIVDTRQDLIDILK